MQSFRRAAARGALLSYSPPTRQVRSILLASRPLKQSLTIITKPQNSPNSFGSLRTFSTCPQRRRDEKHSALDTAKETVEDAAGSVKETASDAVNNVQSGFRSMTSPPSEIVPNETLYAGNLYFETTPEALRETFSNYGEVVDSKIVYDGRGLSKGFGYVTFTTIAEAAKAQAALDKQVFEGRQVIVQFSRPTSRMDRGKNPVGKTIFIGNMSYDMSDQDLNDLFREIKDVSDVRVAIDRRTGQPRGFAHADFNNIASAEKAVELLQSREFYGRKLRIDYSSSRMDMPRRPRQDIPAE